MGRPAKVGHKHRKEGRLICGALVQGMPVRWDGRECILELKAAGYQWQQMEWIGWYNEYKAGKVVRLELGGGDGPQYGSTRFDYHGNYVWDFKVHPTGRNAWAILNDQEAVDLCIRDHGGLGFVLTLGMAEYDDPAASFKQWHDELKGTVSRYEQERLTRGAPSRRRKVSFKVTDYLAVSFEGSKATRTGLRDGWLKEFQKGMRNADGSPQVVALHR